ncbi:hypothetical protein [Nocardioides sp.]|uniref:hypothetical protein n=1 Tax=Nocardioides sp. TaxID=35761 RepID=UPI0037834DF2
MTEVLPTRIPGIERLDRRDWLVLVTDPDVGCIAVRWCPERPARWRCKACGPMDTTDCLHTFAAGVRLAEHLFGLTTTCTTTETTAT